MSQILTAFDRLFYMRLFSILILKRVFYSSHSLITQQQQITMSSPRTIESHYHVHRKQKKGYHTEAFLKVLNSLQISKPFLGFVVCTKLSLIRYGTFFRV
jgi:hypothetical protein